MKLWTEEKLGLLDRRELIQAAAEFGVVCHGMPDSSIIYEILVRQGEMVGRAVTPLEVRVYIIEKALQGYYQAFAEMAGAWAESTRYLILPQWVRDVGLRMRRKYGVKPLFSVRAFMAREKAMRERAELRQARRSEEWKKILEDRLRALVGEEKPNE